MTARDPELQHAVDRAAGELARLIRANPDPKDPDAFARQYVEDLYTEGWRPWPRTPHIPKQAEGAPPTDEFKTRLRRLKGEPDA